MNAIDPDGRNGIITVDKKNKTITVETTIHFSKEDNALFEKNGKSLQNFVKQLADQWNSASGEVEGEDGTYTVGFKITIQSHDSNEERDAAFNSDDTSNRLQLSDEKSSGAKVQNNNDMTIYAGTVSSTTFPHEVGHFLGLRDDDDFKKTGNLRMGVDNIMHRPGTNRRKVNNQNIEEIAKPILGIISNKRVKRKHRKKNLIKIKQRHGLHSVY